MARLKRVTRTDPSAGATRHDATPSGWHAAADVRHGRWPPCGGDGAERKRSCRPALCKSRSDFVPRTSQPRSARPNTTRTGTSYTTRPPPHYRTVRVRASAAARTRPQCVSGQGTPDLELHRRLPEDRITSTTLRETSQAYPPQSYSRASGVLPPAWKLDTANRAETSASPRRIKKVAGKRTGPPNSTTRRMRYHWSARGPTS